MLVEGHCLILPMEPITASRSADEDIYNELMRFKRQLQAMFFAANRSEVLFIEHVSPSNLSRRRHTVIECIPIPRDAAAESVSYFKKALEEGDEEWSQHEGSQCIDTRGKGIRRCVPENFPYFHVEFGCNGGFAHVIENATKFDQYLGKSVIAGLLDIDANVYLKPKPQGFEADKKCVIFASIRLRLRLRLRLL